MGKGAVVLGIIGILLGAGGLGFAFITWNNQNAIQTQLGAVETWYRYYEDIYDVDTINTYLAIPNMSLSIDLSKTSSIHFLFTCLATTIGTTGRSDLTFYYYLDETIFGYARVGTYNGTPTSYFHSVSLQYLIESWSVGTHNISVFVRSTVTVNYVQSCALTVQSEPN